MKLSAFSLHKTYLFALIALLAVTMTVFAFVKPVHAAPMSEADKKAVDDIVTKVMKDTKQTGMSISLTGPKGDYAKAYGLGDRGKKKALDINDRFRIGSVTKTFVSTAVLMQVDKGKLKLTDTLDKYVSGVPNGNKITVKDLLTMRSGVYEYTNDTALTVWLTIFPWWPYNANSALQSIRSHPSQFTPGQGFQYANSNYVLLGMILEKVTGKKIQAVITDDVIKPLGLTNTSYPTGTNNSLPAPASRGYTSAFLGIVIDTSTTNVDYYGAAGAITSTIPDMQKYTQKMRDGALLSPASHKMRQQTFCGVPYTDEGPTSLGYGYGNVLFGKWIGHNGSVPGFDSVIYYEPNSGATFVGMENISMSYNGPIFTKVMPRVSSYLYPGTVETQVAPNAIPAC